MGDNGSDDEGRRLWGRRLRLVSGDGEDDDAHDAVAGGVPPVRERMSGDDGDGQRGKGPLSPEDWPADSPQPWRIGTGWEMDGSPAAGLDASVSRQWRELREYGPVALVDYWLDDATPRREWIPSVLVVVLFGFTAVGSALAGALWLLTATVTGMDRTQIMDTIVHAVRVYLDGHSQGLAVSADTLFATWVVTTVGLWLWSWWFGSFGARLGWALTGLTTAGMVWAGTAPPSRWTAAGLTAIVWGVLSIPAFHGVGKHARVVVVPPQQSAPPARPEPARTPIRTPRPPLRPLPNPAPEGGRRRRGDHRRDRGGLLHHTPSAPCGPHTPLPTRTWGPRPSHVGPVLPVTCTDRPGVWGVGAGTPPASPVGWTLPLPAGVVPHPHGSPRSAAEAVTGVDAAGWCAISVAAGTRGLAIGRIRGRGCGSWAGGAGRARWPGGPGGVRRGARRVRGPRGR